MTVSANRFTFTDQQTNVPVANLVTQNNSNLLNAPSNDLQTLCQNISNLLHSNHGSSIENSLAGNSLVAGALSAIKSVASTVGSDISSGIAAAKGAFQTAKSDIGAFASAVVGGVEGNCPSPLSAESATSTANKGLGGNIVTNGVASNLGSLRVTKDFFSSGINLTATPSSVLSSAANSIMGTNPQAASALKQLSSTCQNSILGGFVPSGQSRSLVSCANGGTRQASVGGCNVNQYANLLAAQNGGTYNPNIFNQYDLVNSTSLLGIAGYKQGLCGIFTALTSNVSNVDAVSKIASNMLGSAATGGDMLSVMDIGANLHTGSVASVVPGIASVVMSNYKTPGETTNSGLGKLSTGFMSAMNNIDPNWTTNKDTGLPSVVNLGGINAGNSSEINTMLRANSNSSAVSPSTDGSVTPGSASSYLLAGNHFDNKNTSSNILSSLLSL